MFSPMFLENKLKFSPYIKEAVIFGNQREFVAALINIDPIVVGKWAEDRGISFTTFMDLSQKQKVAELIRKRGDRNSIKAWKRSISGSGALPFCTSCWMSMTGS